MNRLDIIRETARDPHSYAKKWKEKTGGKVVGYFCTYTPEEIVHASGSLPFRIFGSVDNISLADTHLQAYSCSLVRGGLEEALKGNLSFLDGTVFPHTCDSIQRLSDIWRLNAGFPFHLDVVLPVKLDTASARDYLGEVLGKFRRDLEQSLGKSISDSQLGDSVKLYNRMRGLMRELYLLRSGNPGILTGRDVYWVIKASMVMDRAEFTENLEKLLEELKASTPQSAGKASRRAFLAGGICNHPDFYTLIEDAGGSVVWDELCTGTRSFEGVLDETVPPLEALTKRYSERVVCPAKYNGNTSRADNLLRLVREKEAAGVVFVYLKFCDPQSFDYPYMKEALDRAGIPSMLLEVEEQPQAEGQLRTRFETFMDML